MFLWLFFLFSINSVMHPIHTSVTNINYLPEKKAFEISVRLYKNDFQKIIFQKYGYRLNFEKNPPTDSAKFYMTDYIKRNLIFIVGKKGFNHYQFKDSKVNFEAVWLNLTLPFKKKPSAIILHNSLLYDLFDDQKNLVIFSYLNNEQGFTFSKNKENEEVLLK